MRCVDAGERAASSLLAARGRDAGDHEVIAPLLADAIARAIEKWPGVTVDPGRFGAAIAMRIDGEVPLGAAIAELVLEDVWLAAGCIDGDAAAIACFDATVSHAVARSLRGASAPGESVDDLQQRLRVRLFVGDAGRTPAIASYGGRGSLVAWVRVMATRMRIDAERKASDVAMPSLGGAEAATIANDPELAYLAAHCREAFAAAFRTAFDVLTPRQRNMLRMHLVGGISATAIAQVYAVHAASAKRWLADARAQLVLGVESELRKRLGADTRELESVLRLVRSRLEISVRRLIDESSTGDVG
jgi:RNA polymerase sigma-70 factor (ECF subfamily)